MEQTNNREPIAAGLALNAQPCRTWPRRFRRLWRPGWRVQIRDGMLRFMTKTGIANIPSARRFQLLVEAVTDYAIYLLDPNGHVSSWNTGAQRLKGYTVDEILGRHFSVFFTEEDRRMNKPQHALDTARETGRFQDEGWRVRKNGDRFWALAVLTPARDENGEIIGFAKITRDMTERREAQQALQASERRFRLLVQGVVDYAIFMLDTEGRITNWNSGAERIKGYTADEIVGEHFSLFYTDEDRQLGGPEQALSLAKSTGKYEAEGWRVRKDGSRFFASVVMDAIYDEDGRLAGFAKVTRDISERREAERVIEETREQLFQSQKLEAIGQLTGGVAHDFNNLLQVVTANIERVQRDWSGDETSQHRLHNAMIAAERGARLTRQLLAYARRQPLQPELVNPSRFVEAASDLLRRTLGETIEIESIIGDDLWNTYADVAQLENAILNLALNGRDAMPNGGKLTIDLRNVVVDRAYTEHHPEAKPGQYVMLAVTDDGIGMTKEQTSKAVEPFFTTKPDGTGLGLSQVFGFIKQSGGHIGLYSEPGRGTTVKLYLPRARRQERQEPARHELAEPSAPVSDGGECILVVEDNATVRETVADMLTDLGYRVLDADSGQSALELLRGGAAVDLLFTDVVMPGSMDGPALGRRARKLDPRIGLLFTSGYAESAANHHRMVHEGAELLSKPYPRDELALRIRAALDARPARAAADTASEQDAPLQVLVVEDEALVRLSTVELIGDLGYAVRDARDAEAALALLDEMDRLDVLLADIRLPGLDGKSLAVEVRRRFPDVKVILATGDAQAMKQGSGPVEDDAAYLEKPYTSNDLVRAFRRVGLLAGH